MVSKKLTVFSGFFLSAAFFAAMERFRSFGFFFFSAETVGTVGAPVGDARLIISSLPYEGNSVSEHARPSNWSLYFSNSSIFVRSLATLVHLSAFSRVSLNFFESLVIKSTKPLRLFACV